MKQAVVCGTIALAVGALVGYATRSPDIGACGAILTNLLLRYAAR